MSVTLYQSRLSSASYRVRIALALKQVDVRCIEMDLSEGQHRTSHYLELNPLGLVPALITPAGDVLTQSLAIVQWLDEQYRQTILLPEDSSQRCRVLEFCSMVSSDIHPLQSRRLAGWLEEAGVEAKVFETIARRAIVDGLAAAEQLVAATAGPYCVGINVTAADAWLLPQMRNARLLNIDVGSLPRLCAAEAACFALMGPV